jgi:predicted RNase H-like HicB family nuclease
MSEIQEFTANVHEDSGSLWAEVVELPGCFATGGNLDELREALEEAVSLYLLDEPDRPGVRSMEEAGSRKQMEVGSMRVRVPA